MFGGGGVHEMSIPSHVASKKASFNLFTAIFCGIFFLSISKNFVCLFRALKGPLYEGCNVCVLAKSHMKMCVLVCKSFGTYVGLWHCTGELYAKFAILNVNRSTNEVMFKGFCRKNCPGSLSVVRYTISADEHFKSSFTAMRSPRRTKGRCSSQFDWFILALRADLSEW